MSYENMSPYELGETRSGQALPSLVVYLHDGTDNERRLAASALMKLQEAGIETAVAIPFLIHNTQNPGPQVRQYSLRALKALTVPARYYDRLAQIAQQDPKLYCRDEAQVILERMAPPKSAKEEELEKKKGYVYFLKEDLNGQVKIGSTRDIKQRMETFGAKLPFSVVCIHTIASDHMHYTERLFHDYYADKRTQGEWFQLTRDDIETIQSGLYPEKIYSSIYYYQDPPSELQEPKAMEPSLSPPPPPETPNRTNQGYSAGNKSSFCTPKQQQFIQGLLAQKREYYLQKPVEQITASEAALVINTLTGKQPYDDAVRPVLQRAELG